MNNIKFINTLHTVYFKTWTGDQAGYPPNGGGGGLGCKILALFFYLPLHSTALSALANKGYKLHLIFTSTICMAKICEDLPLPSLSAQHSAQQ